MSKKIVAIGGGENGRTKSDGTILPYETDLIDQEIIRLTGKEHPHYLFLGHSQQTPEYEEAYFNTMKKIYGDIYGCECKIITKKDLKDDFETVKKLIEWADIIYEGGGDTIGMLQLWFETGFDKVLRKAYEEGKVMCGISAGSICWFSLGNSGHPDYIKMDVNKIEALGFIDAYFSPHCNVEWKYDSIKKSLKEIDKIGISVSDCAALEIVDDKYRIIKTKSIVDDIGPYVLKSYWKDNKYIENNINNTDAFESLDKLLNKE